MTTDQREQPGKGGLVLSLWGKTLHHGTPRAGRNTHIAPRSPLHPGWHTHGVTAHRAGAARQPRDLPWVINPSQFARFLLPALSPIAQTRPNSLQCLPGAPAQGSSGQALVLPPALCPVITQDRLLLTDLYFKMYLAQRLRVPQPVSITQNLTSRLSRS